MGLLGGDVDYSSFALWNDGEDLHEECAFKDTRVTELGQVAVETLCLRDVGAMVLQVGLWCSCILFSLVVGKLPVGDDTCILLCNIDVVAGVLLSPDLHDESAVSHLTS